MDILNRIAQLEQRIAHDESLLKKHYQEYRREHPKSEMSYERFKEIRNRKQISVGKNAVASRGEAFLDKDSLHDHLKNGSFTMISAENPPDSKLSPEENAKRTAALKKKLDQMGAVYHRGTGHFFGSDENSFMVHHNHKITPKMLEDLGNEFEQHSVIHSTGGHHHLKVIHKNPKYANDERKGKGFVSGPHLKNIFTKFPGIEKTKMITHPVVKQSSQLTHKDHYFVFKHPNGEESVFQFSFD